MSYIKFEHKKALRFGSRVSLRSNLVNYATRLGIGIKVIHKNKTMTLDTQDLEIKGVHNRNSTHIARYDGYGIKRGEKYYLVDFTFIPDDERKSKVEQDQPKLF